MEETICPLCSEKFESYPSFYEHFDPCLLNSTSPSPLPKKQKINVGNYNSSTSVSTNVIQKISEIHKNEEEEINPEIEEEEVDESILDPKDILHLYPCINCKKYFKIQKLFYCSEVKKNPKKKKFIKLKDCQQKICKKCLLNLFECRRIEIGEFPCKFCGEKIDSKKLNLFIFE